MVDVVECELWLTKEGAMDGCREQHWRMKVGEGSSVCKPTGSPLLLPPAAHTAEDTSDLLQYVKFQSSNFENILIWDGGPNNTLDTVYSVEYKRQVSHPNRPLHDPALQHPQDTPNYKCPHTDQALLPYIQSEVQTVESDYSPRVRASSNHIALGSQGSLSFPIC